MAYCVHCGKEVSPEARMCPQCGHPGPAAQRAIAAAGPLATWGHRFGAYLLDMVVLAIPAAILFVTLVLPRLDDITVDAEGELHGASATDAGSFAIAIILFVIIAILYKPLMEGANGQTLGKKWTGLRVVKEEDGGRIGYGKAWFRWFIGALANAVPFGTFVDHLWPLWDDNKQTLHDKAAKTIVVTTS